MALVSLLICLVVAEWAVRTFELGPEISPIYRENYRLSESPRLGYELVPGSRDTPGHINAHGMRDRERVLAKPASVFRIASLGDSICYGFGCRADETYSSRLEFLLNEASAADDSTVGPRVYEVLNFGVTGYSLAQSVETLRVKALAFDPDVIVMQYCLNDPLVFSAEMEKLRTSVSRAKGRYWERLTALERPFLDHSRLFALVAYALHAYGDGSARDRPRRDPQWQSLKQDSWPEFFQGIHADHVSWSRVSEALTELATLSREPRRPVLIVLFPVLQQLDNYPLEAVHRQVAEEARRHGFAVLDLLEHYRAEEALAGPSFVVDALHPNGIGHEMAAEVIALQLHHLGWLSEGVSPKLHTVRYYGEYSSVARARRQDTTEGKNP